MTQRIPQNFRTVKSAPIGTYTNTDFVTKRGTILFYGGKTEADYILDTKTFYSTARQTLTNPGNNTANDIDFDTQGTLVQPIEVEGTVYVTVPMVFGLASGTASVSCTLTVELNKVNSGTETFIASGAATANSDSFTAVGERGFVYTLSFDVTNTTFNPGDTIRLSVITTAPGANKEVCIGHDPTDRDLDTTFTTNGGTLTQPDTSALTMSLPIKIFN